MKVSSRVLLLGDSRLRRVSDAVTPIVRNQATFDRHCAVLTHELGEFRKKHGFGRAIAAPQLDISYRMIAMNLNGKYKNLPGMSNPSETLILVNPEIIKKSEDSKFTLWDDCMSFPDLFVKVERYEKIAVKWTDVNLERTYVWDLDHIRIDLSELLQHEIDHLDGILATDLALDKDSFVYRPVFENNKAHFQSLVDYTIE
ncbi:aminotransferase class IV [Reticulomyxa filosa]|uniref:Peptide deformylase n=1 Tax=Reticulomyxa filosa TaxID=46433 RepID=X6LWL7_RETFI|nr:aminotransferase class IV [Reticulomyxa filosa]|eukprot:ETO05761.1 aminotransferase class IV [Reticulomyxa filosa]